MRARLFWATPRPTARFIPFLRNRAATKARDTALAVWQGAVNRTPVGSGELRASWNVSIGAPDYTTVGSQRRSPGNKGGKRPAPTPPLLEVVPLNKARYFVANGKAYAGYVEFGSPTTTPQLMLTRAIEAAK